MGNEGLLGSPLPHNIEATDCVLEQTRVRRSFLKMAVGAGVSGLSLSAFPLSAQSRSEGATWRHINGKGTFNIRGFGATGDGQTLDSPAINRCIDAASAVGGGTVYFPAGTYLCYSIRLKSNIALYLDQGATILAANPSTNSNSAGYDIAEPNTAWDAYQDYGHNHWHNSLIWGEGIHDLSILGPGLVWGKGLSRGDGNTELRPGIGNKAIALKDCHNVLLRDFSILKGGHFGVLATGVDNVTIDNLKIDTDRDGMDIDCCKNVRISNCTVNSPWDDGICPKSSFALGYARATENVTITNCYVTAKYQLGTLLDGTFKTWGPGVTPPRTGRIKFGTESNGGFRNITISNCVFEGCYGLALETVDGALLEDITITNITMRECTSSPLFLRLGARMRGPAGTSIGTLRRIYINNVVSHGSSSLLPGIISGIPGSLIEDVRLSDIYFEQIGGAKEDMAQLTPPENEKKYPEPFMFGPLPAYGLFVRCAKNVEMSNVEFALARPDARAAIYASDVQGLDIFRLKTPPATGQANFVLKNVLDFRLFGCRSIKDVVFDKLETRSF